MHRTFSFVGDPFAAFKKFYGKPGLFFLDSSRTGGDGQFSYIGFDPVKTIRGTDLRALKTEFQKHQKNYSGKHSKAVLPGGAVGYLGYEGDFCFGFYNQIVAVNHLAGTVTIHADSQKRIDDIRTILNGTAAHVPVIVPIKCKLGYKSNFTKAAYMAMVKKALQHIRRGDIYQINCSLKVWADLRKGQTIDPIALYDALRSNSPSPFTSYFDDGHQIILSSSPERFLKLTGRTIQMKPMKGTRPRGRNKSEDARLKQDLLRSPKEIAELLMVTDLERNDLGRVCEYGSVKVKAMRSIETYKTVFQATATIEGQLRKDRDQFDLLQATFPSGSVTGCPKIEAMKIIKQLEQTPRGLYTGAFGYISFTGHMDFSVLIRTLFLERNKVSFHVGGGIVADSNPAAEYEETRVKAKAMESALIKVTVT